MPVTGPRSTSSKPDVEFEVVWNGTKAKREGVNPNGSGPMDPAWSRISDGTEALPLTNRLS